MTSPAGGRLQRDGVLIALQNCPTRLGKKLFIIRELQAEGG